MRYVKLGNTDCEISVIALGAGKFGKAAPEGDCVRIIDQAIDLGVNFIDTAYAYGNSEQIIGSALAASGKRDRMLICTKIQPMANDRATILKQAEESLRRLQTDCIDLLLLHRPNPDIPIEESLSALDELVRAGKVRYIGSSGFQGWQLMEALWCATDCGFASFVCESSVYSLMCRHSEVGLIPMLRTYGVGLTVWSPLGGGVLTDRYTRENPPQHMELTDADWALLDTARQMAAEHGCATSQLAMAWCLAQPGVTSVIAGVRLPEQFVDNVGAVDVELTEEDIARLDAVAPPGLTSRADWLGRQFSFPAPEAWTGGQKP
jgi:aryl-alcohol dehydrogenase-like predicted oxidoreductase